MNWVDTLNLKQRVGIFIVLLISILGACDNSGDLEAVSGIEGSINFQGVLPDSIKAVALVVLDPAAQSDMDNIGDYLINYSDPTSTEGDYFIQLTPGVYMGVVVGLLIDPGVFVVNIDEYLQSANIPLVQLTDDPVAFLIQEKEILNKDWLIQF